MRPLNLLLPLFAILAGCDQLGIETPAQQLQRAEADGRAIGSACRHSGRALEDCYQVNKRASKAAIYAGWREMDAYMRENKIEELKPEGAKPAEKPAAEDAAAKSATPPTPKEEKAPAKSAEGPGKPSRPLAGH